MVILTFHVYLDSTLCDMLDVNNANVTVHIRKILFSLHEVILHFTTELAVDTAVFPGKMCTYSKPNPMIFGL